MTPVDFRRVVVVGTTGAGKTTVARILADKWGVPCVELDALYWGPNWTPVPDDVFRERVAQAVVQDAWVVDGNYGVVRHLIWQRADTVIWLDYSLTAILRQLIGRTCGRILRREELWSGNRESLSRVLLRRDSIILWALRTYHRRRRTYSALMRDSGFDSVRFVRLLSLPETKRWLDSLGGCDGDALPLPLRQGAVMQTTLPE